MQLKMVRERKQNQRKTAQNFSFFFCRAKSNSIFSLKENIQFLKIVFVGFLGLFCFFLIPTFSPQKSTNKTMIWMLRSAISLITTSFSYSNLNYYSQTKAINFVILKKQTIMNNYFNWSLCYMSTSWSTLYWFWT